MLYFFGFWAHPAFGGSGFPLQFLSLPSVGLRDFRFNPLRLAYRHLFLSIKGIHFQFLTQPEFRQM
jgi:hypothetical protein